MSVKIMGLVWDLNLPRSEKFILLAYTDHADHDGRHMWPSYAKIAKKTGYNRRQVIKLVEELSESREKKGKYPARKALLLEDGTGKNNTIRWRLDIEACKAIEFGSDKNTPLDNVVVKKKQASGVKKTQSGVESTPEPSINHQLNHFKEEEEGNPTFSDVTHAWLNVVGTISSFIADNLRTLVDEWDQHVQTLSENHPDRNISGCQAVSEAVKVMGAYARHPNAAYLESVMKGWQAEGFQAKKKTVMKNGKQQTVEMTNAEYQADLEERRRKGKEKYGDIVKQIAKNHAELVRASKENPHGS